jgi:hypothetical protein
LKFGSSFLVNEVLSLLEDLGNHVLTNGDEVFVQVTALDQEHRHSDLKGSLLADLGDSALESLDFHNEFLFLVGLFVKESFDALVFLQQEQELVINVDALGSRLQVLVNDSLDGVLGILHDLVVSGDIPEVSLV